MIHPFLGETPRIPTSCFVADSAEIIGDVELGEETSVWFNVTVRGDVNWIRLGRRCNVQDNAVIHVTHETAPTWIGDGVSIAHSSIVHGCRIEDDVLIGMGAIVMDGAHVGSGSIIGAGAVVTAGVVIPPRSLVIGIPGTVARSTTDAEVVGIVENASNYVRYRGIYLGEETPHVNPFYEK